MNHFSYIRQIDHWRAACQRLLTLDNQAPTPAWAQLEAYTGQAIRARLLGTVRQLNFDADQLWHAAKNGDSEASLQQRLITLRENYLQTEKTLDYYGDAINTRTEVEIGTHLAALDTLAIKAMQQALLPLGVQPPPVLTYLDKGLGASILKAGLRLWDRKGINPVAIIKIVRHNLFRPTALIHEVGHQVAYQLDWNQELASALRKGLHSFGQQTANVWSSWASEIAADTFAFVCCGYGAIATLHDVLAGTNGLVFMFHPGDPHPIPYLRVLLGIQMCKQVFGSGHWDQLAQHWKAQYPLSNAPGTLADWLNNSQPVLEKVAEIVLSQPMEAFQGQSILQLIDTSHLHPHRLNTWGNRYGPINSWPLKELYSNSLQMLALFMHRQTEDGFQNQYHRSEVGNWLMKLGNNQLTKSAMLAN